MTEDQKMAQIINEGIGLIQGLTELDGLDDPEIIEYGSKIVIETDAMIKKFEAMPASTIPHTAYELQFIRYELNKLKKIMGLI